MQDRKPWAGEAGKRGGQVGMESTQRSKSGALRVVIGGLLLLAVLAGGIAIGMYLAKPTSGDPLEVAAARDSELEATLRSMEVAAAIGDWEEFSSHVDVSALKSSLQQRAADGFIEGREKGEMDGVDTFVATLLVGLALEAFVTEDTLPTIMRYFMLAIALTDDGGQPADPDMENYGYFLGSEVFVVAGESRKTKEGVYLVFRKNAETGWKLVGLSDRKP